MTSDKAFAAAAFLILLLPGSAQANEFWRCRFGWGSGTVEVDGKTLIGPPADIAPTRPRYPIVQNTDEGIIAMTDLGAGRSFEVVTLDKVKGGIKLITIALEGDYEDHFAGTCVKSDRFQDNGN